MLLNITFSIYGPDREHPLVNFKLNPAGNYMFKFNNENTRTRCELCSKLTIKAIANVSFLCVRFSEVFRGYRKGALNTGEHRNKGTQGLRNCLL